MIRLQDIAEKAGVSRTTVSNVLYGKTSKVSKETIEKVTKLLDETGYVQNLGSLILTKHQSNIVGLVIWAEENHGINILTDPFVTEFLASFQQEAHENGYYVMIIKTKSIDELTKIINRCFLDGLVFIGFEGEHYYQLDEKISKSIVLVDAYPNDTYNFHNIGIDDFGGGFLAGKYLFEQGHNNAIYLAEHQVNSDYQRWLGFKKALSISDFDIEKRFLLLPESLDERKEFYKNNIGKFLDARSVFCSCDYIGIELINCLNDYGIIVPDAVSIIGFDDSIYCNLSRPKLTTIKQDVKEKAILSFRRLLSIMNNQPVENLCVRSPVELVLRDSVKKIL